MGPLDHAIGESATPSKPVILLITRTIETADLVTDPVLCRLSARFDIQLVESPSMALAYSRIVRANCGRVALLLSDMLSRGSDVLQTITEFNREWPEAGVHLFDAVEGRVIFTDPQGSDTTHHAAIRIESNGHDLLNARLVEKMVERHFPEGVRT